MTRLLVFLCALSPSWRRTLWRWWYNRLAQRIGEGEWTFMNYGFQLPSGARAPALKSEDEKDRLCIQLYERVTGSVDLCGATVLEIGSGRGGGASYIARYRYPLSTLGVDYSHKAIRFCRSRHADVSKLNFDFGDAENLSLPAATFDAVINIESSHCYGNISKFFGQVARVLRPGGHFLFADLRESAEMAELREILKRTVGIEVSEEEDITAGVVSALEADDARKRSMIEALVPASIRPLFEEFAGVRGGQIHERLTNRTLVYSRYVARRLRAKGLCKN